MVSFIDHHWAFLAVGQQESDFVILEQWSGSEQFFTLRRNFYSEEYANEWIDKNTGTQRNHTNTATEFRTLYSVKPIDGDAVLTIETHDVTGNIHIKYASREEIMTIAASNDSVLNRAFQMMKIDYPSLKRERVNDYCWQQSHE